MSVELINRITIKKDGVYVSTHSNNDTSPYHSVKIDFLTKAYNEKGQEGLDKEIIDMCFYNCALRGNHNSIIPYSKAINIAIDQKEFINIRKEYDSLDDKAFDIANRFGEYKDLTKEESQNLYNEIKPKLDELRNKRNEYVANIVKEERKKITQIKENESPIKSTKLEVISAECVGGYNDTTIYNARINYHGINEVVTIEKKYHDMEIPNETWEICSTLELTDEEKEKIIQVVSKNPPSIFVDAPPKVYEDYDYDY